MTKGFTLRLIPALMMCGFAGVAGASGFALIEQNASGLGNAYAGSAAVAQDASTIFFNPAGLTQLSGGKDYQFVGALNFINPSAKFSANSSTDPASGLTAGPAFTRFSGTGNGGDAGGLAYVPNLYLSAKLSQQWSVGVGVNAPFGLKTEYDDGWVGRFQALKSEVKTYNINPTVAYQATENLSFGAGLNYQHIDATLTKAVNYSAIVAASNAGAAIAAGLTEGRNNISGDDSAWGYNFGMLWKVSPSTKLGLAYRSAIKYHLTGTHTATHPTTASAAANTIINSNLSTLDQAVSLDLKMPDSMTMSVHQQLSDKWEMMGDLSWTGWAKVQEIRIKFSSGAADDVTPYHFRNTWRVALGAAYKASDQMKYRFGLAFDQTPTNDVDRTARLPDQNRTWLSAGLQYKPAKDHVVDAGFAYLFVKDAKLSTNGGVAKSNGVYARGFLDGTYDSNVKILSVQYTYNF